MARRSPYILMIPALVLALSACSKDQNLDEYHQQQAAQAEARVQAISGSGSSAAYTGAVNDAESGQKIGDLKITLRASSTPVSSSDNTFATNQVTVDGDIVLTQADSQSEGQLKNGSYTPDNSNASSGSISGTILVNGSTNTLHLDGRINGNTFSGTIAPDNGAGLGGTFTLIRGGAPSALSNQNAEAPTDPGSSAVKDYQAIMQDPDCTTTPTNPCTQVVVMSVRDPSSSQSSGIVFINSFSKEKAYLVTLNVIEQGYPNRAFSFPSTFKDNGKYLTLKGSAPAGATGNTAYLDCRSASVNTQTQGWKCGFRVDTIVNKAGNTDPLSWSFLAAPIVQGR